MEVKGFEPLRTLSCRQIYSLPTSTARPNFQNGDCGIRTHGRRFAADGFRDRSVKPLRQISKTAPLGASALTVIRSRRSRSNRRNPTRWSRSNRRRGANRNPASGRARSNRRHDVNRDTTGFSGFARIGLRIGEGDNGRLDCAAFTIVARRRVTAETGEDREDGDAQNKRFKSHANYSIC